MRERQHVKSTLPDREQQIFDDLTFRYFTSTSAPDGLELLEDYRRRSDHEGLAELLRHHDAGTIGEEETWLRDSIDDLLNYYGILEVALMAGLLTSLPPPAAGLASENLGDLIVRIYYEDNYPIPMPRLLRLRLRGAQNLVDRVPTAFAWFSQFLMVSQLVEQDEDVDSFLWLIDGGTLSDDEGDYDIDDLLDVLRDPHDFQERMATPQRRRTELDSALQGFRQFVVFAVQLDHLLKGCSQHRLLAAAMWHHHGYWFRQFASFFGTRVPRALERIVRWKDVKDRTMRAGLTREVRTAQQAFRRLSSGHYGRALNRWT